ncbi:hypothetical protein ABZ892_13490 [Streptomyces sp. NPDC046924]|uniref:hypothetical protein n=1 Tax=Streptomyces sp. NPDC046924 TaxID=3155136 RepID=UPI0033D1A939
MDERTQPAVDQEVLERLAQADTGLPARRELETDEVPSNDIRTVEGAALVTRAERDLAVSHWLLSAAENRDLARAQWRERDRIALLACGGILSAIRLPARLVWCAAGSEELKEVDVYLRQAIDGPVFMSLHTLRYYALVPGRALGQFPARDFPGAACIGRDHYLGVPDVGCTIPRGRSYWCVPMDSPGELCPVEAVEAMARRGRARDRQRACR